MIYKYTVIHHHDIWGNPVSGYDVNDSSKIGQITVNDLSDATIEAALKKDIVSDDTILVFDNQGDEHCIYVNRHHKEIIDSDWVTPSNLGWGDCPEDWEEYINKEYLVEDYPFLTLQLEDK